MELPDFLAGDYIVGTDVTRRRNERFAGRRAQDKKVLPDLAGAVVVPTHLLAAGKIAAKVDGAVETERRNRQSCAGVDRLKEVVDREQQSALLAIVALPV